MLTYLQIIRNGAHTALVLDGVERVTSDANNMFVPTKTTSPTPASTSTHPTTASSEIEFGNFTTNSYVYVGGLPSWYGTKLSMLALPSVVFEPRFKGSIRNILYADDETGKPRRQEVMAYKVGLCPFHSIIHLCETSITSRSMMEYSVPIRRRS